MAAGTVLSIASALAAVVGAGISASAQGEAAEMSYRERERERRQGSLGMLSERRDIAGMTGRRRMFNKQLMQVLRKKQFAPKLAPNQPGVTTF